jgi:hypothetical protein
MASAGGMCIKFTDTGNQNVALQTLPKHGLDHSNLG